MAAHTRINARIDPELARKVSIVQRRMRKSLTEVVKESLEEYCKSRLQETGTGLRGFEAAGFVACADGPSDLSSNYKATLTASLERKT